MNNKGWVGVLIAIIVLCILSIALFGFIFFKFKDQLVLPKLPEPQKSAFEQEPSINRQAEKDAAVKIATQAQLFIVTSPKPNLTTQPLTTPVVRPQIQVTHNSTVTPALASCFNYRIPDGEFKSNKCYTNEDYNKLVSIYADYIFELNTIEFTEETIDITCDGSEFFKDSCEESKEELKDQKNTIERLKKQIQEIVSRGK